MDIWALADLHLSISVPEKTMEIFGERWENYHERIQENWQREVAQEDLVLLPGDICWAMNLEQAKKDLLWIDALPGTKVMIKGNHDYWWSSKGKVVAALPPSIHIVQNSCYYQSGIAVAGTRLWDSPEYNFNHLLGAPKKDNANKEEVIQEDLQDKIFQRELVRLRLSLEQIPFDSKLRIVMTHYPPIGDSMESSSVSNLLEEYEINYVLFGHLHGLPQGKRLFGEKNGITYYLTSCDYLECKPLKIASV